MPDFTPLAVCIGHATDVDGGTGCTVVRHATGAFRGGVAVLGRATATREVPVTAAGHSTDRVDAIFLTGGSAYGLDAAAGVMRWMEERGRGFLIGGGVVPIVPAAAIFDLAPLGRFAARPTAAMAWSACESARSTGIDEGSVGAGTGASVGKAGGIAGAMKGGVGCWVEQNGSVAVGAVAVVNAVGDVRDADGRILAGARGPGGMFLDSVELLAGGATGPRSGVSGQAATDSGPAHTTIAAVITNAAFTRLDVQQLAQASTAAFYRRITPAATLFDGDVIFALCQKEGDGALVAPLTQVEVLAVRALEQAVERAVRFAAGREGIPGLADPR